MPSTSEALRNIEQGGVKIDGATVTDKGAEGRSRANSSCRSASAALRASR